MAGCSLVARGAAPAADLTGSYSGVLRLEGDEVPSSLTVQQDGGRLEATLTTDVGVTAHGQGRLQGTVVRMELTYGDECPGRLELAGQAIDGGERLAGTVDANDCTGPAEGSFSLTRR